MITYILLFTAIALEVFGTMLFSTTQSFTKPLPTFISLSSYFLSLYLLSIIVQKLPIAIVYASWAGLGVFSVALLGYIFYAQSLNWQTIIGLFLIIGSCSQMEDTGGSLKGWEKWGGGFLFGLLLCFFGVVGVVAQLFIEGVKILRNGVKNLRK